jgi:HSP20 family protein
MTKLMRRNEKTQPEDLGTWDPLRGGLSRMDPFRMVREMFQDPFGGMGLLSAESVFRPNLDVTETNDAFVINVDLPGVDEDDVDVQVTGNRLTVSGKREAEETREGDRYVAIERAYGTFTRSFVLPDSADNERIEAQLRNGVLEIKVPKRGEMKGRKVSIQGSSKPREIEASPEQQQQPSLAQDQQGEASEKKAA